MVKTMILESGLALSCSLMICKQAASLGCSTSVSRRAATACLILGSCIILLEALDPLLERGLPLQPLKVSGQRISALGLCQLYGMMKLENLGHYEICP